MFYLLPLYLLVAPSIRLEVVLSFLKENATLYTFSLLMVYLNQRHLQYTGTIQIHPELSGSAMQKPLVQVLKGLTAHCKNNSIRYLHSSFLFKAAIQVFNSCGVVNSYARKAVCLSNYYYYLWVCECLLSTRQDNLNYVNSSISYTWITSKYLE